MSRLRGIVPGEAKPGKPKILIFGRPGVGKTWGALDFPAPYMVDTEAGADLPHYTAKLQASGGAYMGPPQGSTDLAAIVAEVKSLATERHSFRTLIIDSISKVFALEIAREAERLGSKNAFGADKRPAIAGMRALVAALMRLDMTVLLIAHEMEEWGKNAEGQREVIGATYDGWPKLAYELHLALNITKQGPGRYARVTKTRLTGFPDATRFPWSYAEFAARFGRDAIEAPAEPVALASAEQLADFARLADAVRMPDGWQDKCLSAAGVETLEELPAEKIAAMLAMMKERANAV